MDEQALTDKYEPRFLGMLLDAWTQSKQGQDGILFLRRAADRIRADVRELVRDALPAPLPVKPPPLAEPPKPLAQPKPVPPPNTVVANGRPQGRMQ